MIEAATRTEASRQVLASKQRDLEQAKAAHALLVDELQHNADDVRLQTSRDRVRRFEAEVAEATILVQHDERREQGAQTAAAARDRAAAWANVERLLRERHEIAKALQRDLDDAVASLAELVELNERVYAAIPAADRPMYRPEKSLGAAICTSVELYLYAHSNGLVCRQGMSAHSAAQRPDIGQASQALAEIILSRRGAQ
jgi:hypothetical protein